MLEELISSGLWNACCEFVESQPDVRLKEKYRTPRYQEKREMGEIAARFLRDETFYTRWDILPKLDYRSKYMRTGSLAQKAWLWFAENDDRIVQGFIRARYDGSWKRAMLDSMTYDNLHNEYLRFFAEKRTEFMEKETKALEIAKGNIIKQGKNPPSHGGVANLLKVLTKTMQQEGASIVSIAKMQYGVCIQAGILLPDEFLVDVLVADEIANADVQV